ncbi:hypothetical protein RB594_006992 [Gaeumannomyces avenae]
MLMAEKIREHHDHRNHHGSTEPSLSPLSRRQPPREQPQHALLSFPAAKQSPSSSSNDLFEVPPAKRQRTSPVAATMSPPPAGSAAEAGCGDAKAKPNMSPTAGNKSPTNARASLNSATAVDAPSPMAASRPTSVGKPRRVRTGCLTCRERHLKCDEGTPDCLNCRKSRRECRRGVRLNFIDIQVKNPAYIPPRAEWNVRFEDESRMIASEYQGGLEKYVRIESPPREVEPEPSALQPQTSIEMAGMPALSMPAETNTPMAMSNFAPSPIMPPMDRRFSEMLLPMPDSRRDSMASVQMPPTRATPHGSMDMGANNGSFNLAALQDKCAIKEEPGPRTHQYKASDVSSVASSLVPQGNGPPSGASVSDGQDNSQNK